MKFKEAVKSTNEALVGQFFEMKDKAVSATNHNWYFIKNGLEAFGATSLYWLIVLVYMLLSPVFYIYALLYRMVKK